jgi:hypothetical protein
VAVLEQDPGHWQQSDRKKSQDARGPARTQRRIHLDGEEGKRRGKSVTRQTVGARCTGYVARVVSVADLQIKHVSVDKLSIMRWNILIFPVPSSQEMSWTMYGGFPIRGNSYRPKRLTVLKVSKYPCRRGGIASRTRLTNTYHIA